MNKIVRLLLIFFLFIAPVSAQQIKLYNPFANTFSDIDTAIKKAFIENKFVLIQAGGNWCRWCIEFERFCKADIKIDSLIKSSFIIYHLNYSKENYNKEIFAKYGYPQRFGFPVFLILNGKGERIHTQNSTYLEDGKKSYDKQKVFDFLDQWNPKALDAKAYFK